MGFKTFTIGEVLAAAEVNDYLMKQTVIVCTSGTRPSSPPQGMVIYETDTNLFYYYNLTWLDLARAFRPPLAAVSRPAGQLISSGGSGSPITFTNIGGDTGGMVNLGVTPTDVVIPFNGSLWTATAGGAYGASATGFRAIAIARNGTVLPGGEQKRLATNSADPLSVTVPDFVASAGDIITMVTTHTQGTAITISNPTMSVRHIGHT